MNWFRPWLEAHESLRSVIELDYRNRPIKDKLDVIEDQNESDRSKTIESLIQQKTLIRNGPVDGSKKSRIEETPNPTGSSSNQNLFYTFYYNYYHQLMMRNYCSSSSVEDKEYKSLICEKIFRNFDLQQFDSNETDSKNLDLEDERYRSIGNNTKSSSSSSSPSSSSSSSSSLSLINQNFSKYSNKTDVDPSVKTSSSNRSATFLEQSSKYRNLSTDINQILLKSIDLINENRSLIGNEQITQQTRNVNQSQPKLKKFVCAECQNAFTNRSQLNSHIRTHTGERPFVCDYNNCRKSFTRNEELTRHRRIHSGIRPYQCRWCEKRFGRKDHLRKHERTHERRLRSAFILNNFELNQNPNNNNLLKISQNIIERTKLIVESKN